MSYIKRNVTSNKTSALKTTSMIIAGIFLFNILFINSGWVAENNLLRPLSVNEKLTQDKDRMIQRIGAILRSNKPHIMEKYDNIRYLSEEEKELLRQEIYKIKAAHFSMWGLSSVLHKATTPYFENSHINALFEVFPELGLNRLGFALDWTTKGHAIASIRYAMERAAPHILRRYDKLDELSQDELMQLREDIYKITGSHFRVWGLSRALDRNVAPYFDGSYIDALIAVFPQLGLNPLGFYLRWGTKAEGVHSIYFVLSREAPHIIERYEKRDTLSQIELQTLKDDIYKIKSAHFKMWGISAALRQHNAPYFNGSYIDALIATFPELSLDPLGFGLDWSGRERGIASVRFVLSREVPHIMRPYKNIDKIDDSAVAKLRERIYAITPQHLHLWGLSTIIDKRYAPYFDGDYVKALKAVFNHPRLNLQREGFEEVYKRQRAHRYKWRDESDVIKNVRTAIHNDMPDLIYRYDRIDSLSPTEIGILQNDFYKVKRAHFKMWGIEAALKKTVTPYAICSYIDILRFVFPKLHLNPLGFHLDWETKDKAIESIRYTLNHHVPHIMERYERLDKLDKAQIEALKTNIYRISAGHFYLWGFGKIFRKRECPYFNGSYIEALIKVFDKLELDPLGFRLDWSTKERGIASVWFAMTREVPHLIEQYNRLDELAPAQIEVLRNEFYGISEGNFGAWGLGSALHREYAPYFNGSHIDTLVLAFPRLHLNPLGFRLDWSNRERACESIRFVLQREAPHIMEQFNRIEKLGEDEIAVLREDIYKINSKHFLAWGLRMALDKSSVSCFKGSYIIALATIFKHPKLKLVESGFLKPVAGSEIVVGCIPDDLLAQFIPLVEEESRKAADRRRNQDPLAYMSACMIGLAETLAKYPPAHPKFERLARARMNFRILDQKRQEGRLSRDTIKKIRLIADAEEECRQRGVISPSVEELVENSGVPKNNVIDLLIARRGLTLFSQVLPAGYRAFELDNLTGTPVHILRERYTEKELREFLEDFLDRYKQYLSPQEQKVIEQYHLSDQHLTMKEIGIGMALSESRISQIYHSGINKLKRRIAKDIEKRKPRSGARDSVKTSPARIKHERPSKYLECV